LAKLEKEFPNDPDVLYENARFHLKAWNGAVERMFEKAPASFRVNQLSAEIFEIQGRYDEAVAEYRKAIQKSPDTLVLHYRLGRALLLRSHEPEALTEARREFEAELKLNPYDAVAHYQIAQILEVQQQPDAAAKALERTLELSPDFPEALVALARYRSRANNHTAAIGLLERVVKLQPSSESSWYALMVAYRNAGRTDDAVAAKQKLDALQQSTAGEFSDFLRRIGETPQP
jgi:tetratricopeptide (TPR) repeat protein